MRISAYEGERGYVDCAKRPLYATCDGVRLNRVVRCDTGNGTAWVHAVDRDGHIRIDRVREAAIIERVYGSIRAFYMDGTPVDP